MPPNKRVKDGGVGKAPVKKGEGKKKKKGGSRHSSGGVVQVVKKEVVGVGAQKAPPGPPPAGKGVESNKGRAEKAEGGEKTGMGNKKAEGHQVRVRQVAFHQMGTDRRRVGQVGVQKAPVDKGKEGKTAKGVEDRAAQKAPDEKGKAEKERTKLERERDRASKREEERKKKKEEKVERQRDRASKREEERKKKKEEKERKKMEEPFKRFDAPVWFTFLFLKGFEMSGDSCWFRF